MARIYRVVVRGHVAELDDEVRAALLAEAEEHSIFRSAFTADGTFTYDERLVAFNLRYEIRVPDDADGAEAGATAVDEALARASAWLSSVGIGHKHLRATATDMADLWREPRR